MPMASGVSMEIADASGTPIYRRDVPGSAFIGNSAGTKFHIRPGFEQTFGRMRIRSRRGSLTMNLDAIGPALSTFVASKLTWVVRFGPDACREKDLACTGSGRLLICY